MSHFEKSFNTLIMGNSTKFEADLSRTTDGLGDAAQLSEQSAETFNAVQDILTNAYEVLHSRQERTKRKLVSPKRRGWKSMIMSPKGHSAPSASSSGQ
jgi:hypothetical protein